MKSQSYSFEIKDLLTQFLCAFDDVVIKRYDKDRNAREDVSVRYVLAPKQRVMYDIVNKAQNLTLPVVAINVTGISRDTTRVFNKLDSVYNPISEANNSAIKMPVPINIEVSMSILARYMQDMDQILSNFIPYNNPYIILSWKEPATTTFDPVEIRSEVLWGGSISLTEPTDTTYSDKFRIVADTSFTIKGWLFKNQNEISKQIYFIDNNFRTTSNTLILTEDNYSTLANTLSNYTDTETISISAIPTITNIFYNTVGKLHEITTNFSINQQLTSNNNFMFYGTNYDKVTTILLSSNNTITGTVSTITPPYTGSVTGTILDPIYYNIVNDNIITINLPYLQYPGNFNFILCNPVGCTNSNLVNNFTFIIPPSAVGPQEQTQLCITFSDMDTEQITLTGSLLEGNFTGATSTDVQIVVSWDTTYSAWIITYGGIILDSRYTPNSTSTYTGETNRYLPVGMNMQFEDAIITVSSTVNAFGPCSAAPDQTILCANILTYDGVNSTDKFYTLSGSLSAGYFSGEITGTGPLSDGTVVLEWDGTNWVGSNTASPTYYTSGITSDSLDPTGILFASFSSGAPEAWSVYIDSFGACCGGEQPSVIVNLDYWDGQDQNVNLTLTGSLTGGSFTDGTYTLEWDTNGPAGGWTITATNGVVVDNWIDNTTRCSPLSAVIYQSNDNPAVPNTIFTVTGWGA